MNNEIRNTLTSYTMEYMDELREVNQKLWDIEDKLRKKEAQKQFDNDFIQYARKVYYLNDLRYKIKNQINKETNSIFIEEKEYQKY